MFTCTADYSSNQLSTYESSLLKQESFQISSIAKYAVKSQSIRSELSETQ